MELKTQMDKQEEALNKYIKEEDIMATTVDDQAKYIKELEDIRLGHEGQIKDFQETVVALEKENSELDEQINEEHDLVDRTLQSVYVQRI